MNPSTSDPAAPPEPGPAAPGYHAFISYSHADSVAVRAIQSFLEDYRLPAFGATPAPRLRIYRDETDLRTGDLDREISGGLYESSHLLVCVSPSALTSEWVAKEVAAFRALRPDAVIPVLLRGQAADVQRLVGLETRFADLTRGRRSGPFGRSFDRQTQVELVRIVARLADTDVRTLIPWHEERRKRRQLWAGAVAGGVVSMLALAGAGFLLQRQAAELERQRADQETERAGREQQQREQAEARKQGDGALALLDRGLFAPAATALARLGPVADTLDDGRYARALRFLQPRLLGFGEAVAGLRPGQAARWRETNLVRGPDGSLRELPGAAIQLHAFVPASRPAAAPLQLVVVDVAKRVALYDWPTLVRRGPHELGTVCPEKILVLQDGTVAVDATEMHIMSDEDTATAQVAGDSLRFVLAPDGRPATPQPRPGAQPAPGCTTPMPGRPQLAPPSTTQGRLAFPRLRDEPAFWRPAPASAATRPEALTVQPLQLRMSAPFGELRASRIQRSEDERADLLRNLDTDAVRTGLVRLDGRSIALSMHVTGNQSTAINFCEFDPASRELVDCGHIDMTVTGRSRFSPDYRWLLVTMSEVQEDPFRLVDVAGLGRRCTVPEHPGDRVTAAAFGPDGKQFAVVTLDHELWLYALAPGCEARVTARFGLPRTGRGNDGAGTLAWLTADSLVWVPGRGDVFAFEARSGLLLWSQSGLWPGGGGGVEIQTSDDGRLFLLRDDRQLQLATVAGGTALSGRLDAAALRRPGKRDGPGAKARICEARVATDGTVRLRIDSGDLCGEPADGSWSDWLRLAPDDPALGFDNRPGLAHRTAIDDRDGRTPVTLQALLGGGR